MCLNIVVAAVLIEFRTIVCTKDMGTWQLASTIEGATGQELHGPARPTEFGMESLEKVIECDSVSYLYCQYQNEDICDHVEFGYGIVQSNSWLLKFELYTE